MEAQGWYALSTRLFKGMINELYQGIILPTQFVKNFKSKEEFRTWAKLGTINDLKQCIHVFENYELYEHCAIMQDAIDERVDNMLSGLGFD